MKSINRRAALFTGLSALGGLLLPARSRAAEFPPGQLVVKNDFDEDVGIAVFHPDALDRHFETWGAAPANAESALQDKDGKPFIVGPDWGVQVFLKNSSRSPMQRIANVGKITNDGTWKIICTASSIVNNKIGYSEARHVKRNQGYTIDGRFGERESDLLKDALAVFYERIAQSHERLMPELLTKAVVKLADDFPKDDFGGVDEDRAYLIRQFERMGKSTGENPKEGDVFPRLILTHGNEPAGNWVARAYLNKVQVHLGRPEGRYDGSFEMEINAAYMFSPEAAHYSDRNYWGGVIAHEALHNLGHSHPSSRDDPRYYEHQIILVEAMIMSGGKSRFGDRNPAPVMCGGRPRG
jgi:hypothetical protein